METSVHNFVAMQLFQAIPSFVMISIFWSLLLLQRSTVYGGGSKTLLADKESFLTTISF
jgi:hypothetical protein